MKKIILLAALLMGVAVANAQVTVQGSKFSDNWSLTFKGGMVSPIQNYAFWSNARGVAGLELRKQVTSVLGIGVEGEASFNTSSWNKTISGVPSIWGVHSANIVDHQLVGLFSAINLSNWFGGYQGTPRALELEAVLGTGWWHGYKTGAVADDNAWYTKAGLNINFNLGESKAWTIALKPAIVWNMDYNASNKGYSRFNANGAAAELEAGVTYHFGNSNGTHHMVLCPKKYTQEDLDAVNAKVNDLRSQLSNAQSDLDAANNRANQLARDLDACKAQKNKVVEVKSNSESLETNVFFAQGKSVVTKAQMPNVERVATYLKNHKNMNVVIKGYASPEGSKEINEKLAKARANAVKTLLVKNYKISANRITAEGQGVGNMFSEPDWNRVSICNLVTEK
jgi:OmpA-OmpF porin, OOP family